MKYITHLSILVILAVLFSCKKEGTSSSEQGNKISSKDPVALSKSIKAWHGIRIAGSIPKSIGGGNAPVIEAPEQNYIHAFTGKFAIVMPVIASGDVAGYYVGIQGASEYFKIDYTKPRITERRMHAATERKPPHSGAGFRPDSTGIGNTFIDSSIVLTLPADMQIPDTFCITYSAYDISGNVSDSVTSCIIVSALGGDASTGYLNSNWRMFASKDTSGQKLYDTIQFNKWVTSPDFSIYYCNTIAAGITQVNNYCDNSFAPCSLLNVTDSDYIVNRDLMLGVDGAMTYSDSSMLKRMNISTSGCSAFNFDLTSNTYISHGGWTVKDNKMIIVYEFDGDDTPDYQADEFNYQKISDNEFRLDYNGLPDGEGSYIFKRL